MKFLCMSFEQQYKKQRISATGVLNTTEPQIIMGLMVGNCASLGLDFATFSVLVSIQAFLLVNYAFCGFFQSQSEVDK